ncbi:hypothetical protein MBRA1_002541 [Malassezia brasiliensis]|uniref:Uncharacterized protein n=1 Tax=Malassezia brasiliensis TaxID=1821822 RepID=A0AAF0DV38_9BASI|nr:hypothetical protein MBRA1_002541 [Malassezia brasiliensis]
MALPSTPFGDTQAIRRRFSTLGGATSPEMGAVAQEEGPSPSPRRLSMLTRNLSLRGSPRERASSITEVRETGTMAPPVTQRASTRTDMYDAPRGPSSSPARATARYDAAPPIAGAYPGASTPVRDGVSSARPGPRRATSPLSLRSLSRVSSMVFPSERRRETDAGLGVPSSDIFGPHSERAPSRAMSGSEAAPSMRRRPSFFRRSSAQTGEPVSRMGAGRSYSSASAVAQAERAASPGLHVFPGPGSPRSSGTTTPAPLFTLGDEVPRSVSPLGISEVVQTPRMPSSAERVVVRVAPTATQINMFGPLQVASHYSLSGRVTLELPVCSEVLELCTLDVHLLGYSMYVDSSARFSSVRICDVKQEPVQTVTPFPSAAPQTRFEVDFDLFVPGWLPASFVSRFASTFYSLEAVATIAEQASSGVRSVAEVRSAPLLVRISRSRDMVPIPVAQLAMFTGEDVPEPKAETTHHHANPFLRNTNPFRSMSSRNPFLHHVASHIRHASGGAKDHAAAAHRETHRRMTSRVPLRHFSHVPKIPLPVPAVIDGKVYEHLQVKLTLSVPAHTSIHYDSDKGQAPLVFGLQVELDPLWAQCKMWSDLRLCELEAMCVQMEKYSSTLSRSYCTAFSLPLQGDVNATQLPVFDAASCAPHAPPAGTPSAASFPYNRALLEGRIRQQRAGTAPTDRRNHAERYRSYTVGPLPQTDAKGKKKQRDAPPPSVPAPPAPTPAPTGTANAQQGTPTRKKKSLTAPFSRLSMFSSHREHHDDRATPPAVPAESLVLPPPSGAPHAGHENPKASYVFDGSDGFGMALSTKKVRLSFSLPMVPSNGIAASRSGTTQLLPDYESPHVRVRHKLKVKLRFGYGASQLALNAGTQSLVMSVPVRFTESPPSEALAQAAPIIFPPSAQKCVPAEGEASVPVPAAYTRATHAAFEPGAEGDVPYLPAYVQLFREDGSRLVDESETLPRYPSVQNTPHVPTERDVAFAAYLENALVLAADDEREDKTAAPTSVVDTLHTADELFEADAAAVGPQIRVDDDMLDAEMQQSSVMTGANGLDYDLDLDAREMNGARSPNVFADAHS